MEKEIRGRTVPNQILGAWLFLMSLFLGICGGSPWGSSSPQFPGPRWRHFYWDLVLCRLHWSRAAGSPPRPPSSDATWLPHVLHGISFPCGPQPTLLAGTHQGLGRRSRNDSQKYSAHPLGKRKGALEADFFKSLLTKFSFLLSLIPVLCFRY